MILAARQLLQASRTSRTPPITVIRSDANANEIAVIRDRIAALIQEAGCSAA